MVTRLKDINKERIKIRRDEQKKISVNQEIKQAIEQEADEKETHAETVSRVLKTNHQMTDLLITMVENVEKTPSKMGDILAIIPHNLRNLFEAIINEKNKRKEHEIKK